MKKLMMITLAFAGITAANARESRKEAPEGSVIYEQVMKLDLQLEGDASEFAHALPKERRSEKILYFTGEAALYQNHKSASADENLEADGGEMIIRMEEPDNRTYFDLTSGQVTEQKEFMSRMFLIESLMDRGKWKLTGNQREILGYQCQEAVREEEGSEVHAWFSPEIPVPAGPGSFSNLPGIVLAVEKDEGDFKLEAIVLDLTPLEPGLMKKPSKGKKVSEEEYQAIVDEKLKEMGIEGGEGGGHATFVVKIQQ